MGRTVNNEPTMTDQSQKSQTDINVIVTQFLRTGQTPVGKPGMYADFSQLPEDLRGFIEMGRSIETLHSSLPPELQDLKAHELFAMTNEQIMARIVPPNKPADEKKDEQK